MVSVQQQMKSTALFIYALRRKLVGKEGKAKGQDDVKRSSAAWRRQPRELRSICGGAKQCHDAARHECMPGTSCWLSKGPEMTNY